MGDREHAATTLADVAREAGVSLATASRALNGSTRNVRADLRERVLMAAAALSYSPNAPAQAMARGRTNVVGLLVHDIADPYFSSIAAGVIRAAEQHRLVVTIASTERRPEKELEYLAALRAQRASAAIIVGSRLNNRSFLDQLGEALTAFERSGGRAALISQQRLPFDTVVTENRAGARALAMELVDLGHRQFAVLAGPADLLTARDRLAGFKDGLERGGVELSDERVVRGAFTRDGGYEAMLAMLDKGIDPGCVFAVNDVMAVGAMAALRHRKLRLPQDVAVAGFDDIVTLRDVTPSLTTVHLPLEEIGLAALEMVRESPSDKPRVRRFPGSVVLRDSTPRMR